jgi:hypothetical protein
MWHKTTKLVESFHRYYRVRGCGSTIMCFLLIVFGISVFDFENDQPSLFSSFIFYIIFFFIAQENKIYELEYSKNGCFRHNTAPQNNAYPYHYFILIKIALFAMFAVALFADPPVRYFYFLRFFSFLGIAYIFYWKILFTDVDLYLLLPIFIIFNPFFQFHFTRSQWEGLDRIAALLLFVSVVVEKMRKTINNYNETHRIDKYNKLISNGIPVDEAYYKAYGISKK